jgi:hypothetical protein
VKLEIPAMQFRELWILITCWSLCPRRQFLESLGVDDAVRNLERAVGAKKVRRTSAPRDPIAVVPIGPTRRSSR